MRASVSVVSSSTISLTMELQDTQPPHQHTMMVMMWRTHQLFGRTIVEPLRRSVLEEGTGEVTMSVLEII